MVPLVRCKPWKTAAPLLTPREITTSKGSFERQTAFEVFKAHSLVPDIIQRAREGFVVNAVGFFFFFLFFVNMELL